MEKKQKYVLVTSARNEELYIKQTLESVVSQNILPVKWVIVSDGSTDRTNKIVKRFETKYSFIKLVCRKPDLNRNFGSKVFAIREGEKQLNGIDYDYIGNLDADVSFKPHFYERIIEKFQENCKLGMSGGILLENCNGKWVRQRTSTLWSISGPIQVFRHECYEDIGGYIPLRMGGVDTVAEIMARMNGWEVRAFADIKGFHHRRTGTENCNILIAMFRLGIQEYMYGSHPLFEVIKCLFRIIDRPYLFGSIFRIAGYFWAFFRKDKPVVNQKVVNYVRREQIQRLHNIF